MNYKRIRTIVLYALAFSGLLLANLAARSPQRVEALYSSSLYRWLIPLYSRITGFFPFSVAELVVVSLVVLALYLAVRGAVNLVRTRRLPAFSLSRLGRLVLVVAGLYTAFILMWGLNYHRPSFAELTGKTIQPGTAQELHDLALDLIGRANELRSLVQEDQRGVMRMQGSTRDMFRRADLGYLEAAKLYPQLGGKFGPPKAIVNTWYMNRTGIGGIYIPFTAEANVNVAMPHIVLPFCATHEMAHQRGFAREDEANYIAYLTCVLHPDPDFQYSGVVFALINTLRPLRSQDAQLHSQVVEELSKGVKRDLDNWNEYLSKYQGGLLQRISDRVNDAYLRSNRQTDGIQSYGRMVDLLLAEMRERQKN